MGAAVQVKIQIHMMDSYKGIVQSWFSAATGTEDCPNFRTRYRIESQTYLSVYQTPTHRLWTLRHGDTVFSRHEKVQIPDFSEFSEEQLFQLELVWESHIPIQVIQYLQRNHFYGLTDTEEYEDFWITIPDYVLDTASWY